jgi:hypothetical protein
MALYHTGQEEHDAVGRRMAESRMKLIASYQQLPPASSSTLAALLGSRFSIPGLTDWVRHNMAGLSTHTRAPIRALLEKQDALSVNSAAYDLRQACKDRDIFLCPDGEWLARITGLDIGLVKEKGLRMPEFIREHFRKKAMPHLEQEKLAYQRSKTPEQLKVHTEFQPEAEHTRTITVTPLVTVKKRVDSQIKASSKSK